MLNYGHDIDRLTCARLGFSTSWRSTCRPFTPRAWECPSSRTASAPLCHTLGCSPWSLPDDSSTTSREKTMYLLPILGRYSTHLVRLVFYGSHCKKEVSIALDASECCRVYGPCNLHVSFICIGQEGLGLSRGSPYHWNDTSRTCCDRLV